MDEYSGREQTGAKHFILKRYLQALAFKVLRAWDVTYVDGFSGPWESTSADFSDTSFMIAIQTLKDAQELVHQQTGTRRTIRCFFSENNASAFAQLEAAVRPFHEPDKGFEVSTFKGDFVDAVPQIQALIGQSFPLIFIDPTGWTGYPFDKIKALFDRPKCEVLINFMYDFVNRFVASNDEDIIASLDPILGGPGWNDRRDKSLPRGAAVESLFRDTLKVAGGFDYVVSTKIDKSTADRPHFFIAYATKDRNGLKAYRQIEYDALREHAKGRAAAKERKREAQTGIIDMFAADSVERQGDSIDDIVAEQKDHAAAHILKLLTDFGPMAFAKVVDLVLQAHMLRETNVKDVCVALAADRKIQNTWGGGNRKPSDEHLIQLVS